MRCDCCANADELFRIMLRDHVAPWSLVLRSVAGAYSESFSNSNNETMVGASHFLHYERAVALPFDEIEMPCLGGARTRAEGLHSLKGAFNTKYVESRSIGAYVGSSYRRCLSSAAPRTERSTRTLHGQ